MSQKFEAADVWRGRGKSKHLDVFPRLGRQLHSPARLFVGLFPKVYGGPVDVRVVHMPGGAATAEDAISRMIEVE